MARGENMASSLRWTSADLESMPEDGKRYEIIDGELYVSKQPHFYHQQACGTIYSALYNWSKQTGLGRPSLAPGVIFADDDDVAPDVVWVSKERLAITLWPDGKLHAAPELVVEVLSPGVPNERRDKEAKLKLYSRRGVSEYWVVDWRLREITVYRRQDAELRLIATMHEADVIISPLLPGFSCRVAELFADIPHHDPDSQE
jgi:Uma2 family endonuclease